MDRKYHLLTEENCAGLARGFLPYAEEAFLVTLANKGLYKRACKDLETLESCELEAQGQILLVKLSDAVVQLKPNPAESVCSCPSRTVCKHILMAVLLAAEYAQGAEIPAIPSAEPNKVPEPAPFLELEQADLQALQKQVGKKAFEDALHLVHTGWGAKLIEGEMLETALTSEAISVYFPKQQSIQNAVCKCGEKGICKHKLIGILSYLAEKGKILEETFASIRLPDDSLLELLRAAADYSAAILEKGLVCCGEMDIEVAVQLSLRLETAGAQNIGRLLRSLSKDLQNMLGKHVAFQPEVAFATLSRIYHTAALVLEQPTNAELTEYLIEGGRSSYSIVPRGTFYGLGAYPWQTRSGFCGITALVYYEEKHQLCTCTVSIADYYEKTAMLAADFSAQLTTSSFWMQSVSLQKISKNKFTLENFRINRQNRISSSQKTACSILETTQADIIQQLPVPKIEREHYSYFPHKRLETLFPLLVNRISETHFDQVQQRFSFVAQTEEQAYLIELPYTPYHEMVIRQIKILFAKNDWKGSFWMLCREQNEQLRPISILTNEGVWNIYFEEQHAAGGDI